VSAGKSVLETRSKLLSFYKRTLATWPVPHEELLVQIDKNVTGVHSDVSNLADLDRLYATVKQQKGRIDILFANAGVGEFAPLGATTEEHFDKTFDINVKALLLRTCRPHKFGICN
jgi:NAD(P)-dependent dehydrogenase (short-subunit alcohol dehydrogenase family)